MNKLCGIVLIGLLLSGCSSPAQTSGVESLEQYNKRTGKQIESPSDFQKELIKVWRVK